MYMADNANLLKDGQLDVDALRELSRHAMTVNPSLEIYLLDSNGTVYAPPSSDADHAKPVTLDTNPITTFINGEATFPLYGDYPGDRSRKRTFSAHPLTHEGQLKGYVYVVLGGEKYSTLLERVTSSYVLRNLLITVGSVLMLTFVAGLLVFSLLTRRLKQLRSQVTLVRTDHASPQTPSSCSCSDSAYHDDELGALAKAYDQLNAQLAGQYDELQRSDRGRRELFANISHDLRTPLTALSGYIETLKIKLEESDRDLQPYADIAYRQTQKLWKLVDQLLELSTINSGEITLTPETFSLIELVHDIKQDFRIKLTTKNVQLNILPDLQTHDFFDVDADIFLIQRVFENLLSNAIEHTPPRGQIYIELRNHRHNVRVCVADSGAGINEQQVSDIFSRYHSGHQQHRIPTKRRTSHQHAGLGLAIVKGILELHDSPIEVSTRSNAGTRFYFSLPRPHSSSD